MRTNTIRERLNAGLPTIGTHIHATWPSVVELIGHTGLYDYVEFVAEYGPYDLHDLDNLCRAAEIYDLGTMIKIDWANNEFVAQRAIGSGFQSVLFSDIRTAEDARNCVRYVRADTPEDGGTFGVATRRFTYMGYGGSADYVRALQEIVIVLMLEKKPALDNLEEILSVPGVDMIQWGPADFSMSIGKAGRRGDPEVQAAEQRVIDTCLKMGIHPRIELGSADGAKRYLDMGVRHFCIGTDTSILYQWWKNEGDALRKAVGG
ncbi:MAG: 2,4-dihydroxyhept-2-ene-1,7-dioic acid aldolase [Chloroflexi bacterium]|nr:2,4-dihydroxyhept-2-ene-1,7-dioic acid aldolase [Chloroflexota bacterium]